MSKEVAALNRKLDALHEEIQAAYRNKPDIDAVEAAERHGHAIRHHLAVQAQTRHDSLIKRLEFREKTLNGQLDRALTRAAQPIAPTTTSLEKRRQRSLADDFAPGADLD